ncbi:hypothetical protein AGOR_G00044150 [Albula goreensis]|uniref:C-type lectin domain-containing protein n=1 Tax=Albula goreensis TaxID=1534307 RepID=A0A8T3E6B5_9TELE|nr:hypothetical protein AGOR_G00044150 [Albula goreensis]
MRFQFEFSRDRSGAVTPRATVDSGLMMSSCLFLLLLVLELVAASPRQFHFVNEPKSWTDAQAHCRSAYRDLVSLGDREEMAAMMASASAVWHDVSSSSAWIGLYDDIEDGWHWSLAQDGFYGDGEREFRNWQKGEPDNRRGAENCTEFRLSMWRDKNCSIGRQFICFDGTEGSGAGKLVLVKKRLDWRGAQAYCRENHTDLASVRSQAENEAIRALAGRPRVWIGLSRSPGGGQDGRDSTFRNWAHQQPNNRRGEEHCVEIRLKSSTWNDAPCGARRPFFCYSEIESTTVPPSTVGMANAETRVTDIPTSPQGVTEPWSELVTQIQTATEQTATVDPAEGGHTQHLTEDNLVLIRENRTWLEAVTFCRQHHVDLVSVPTVAVQSLVAAAARGASTPHVWLGLRYTCVLDLWFWLSPEGGCYSNWAPGKGPQGMVQCGVTGALESDGGQHWVSLPETQRLNFICSTCGKSTQ